MTGQTPQVSVVVPAFNAGAFLRENIESIRVADPNAEIIIVDDASNDDTRQIAEQAGGNVRCISIPSSGGNPGKVRNVGFSSAKGEFLASIDADDLMTPDRVRCQVEFLQGNADAAIVFCDYQNFKGATFESITHFQRCSDIARLLDHAESVVLPPDDAVRLLLTQNYSSPSTMMMRRSVFDDFGGYSEGLQTSEDFHFFYRLARTHVIGVSKVLGCLRRYHESNLTNNQGMMLKGYRLSRAQLLATESNPRNRRFLHAFLLGIERDLSAWHTDMGEYVAGLRHAAAMFAHVQPWAFAEYISSIRALLRASALGVVRRRK